MKARYTRLFPAITMPLPWQRPWSGGRYRRSGWSAEDTAAKPHTSAPVSFRTSLDASIGVLARTATERSRGVGETTGTSLGRAPKALGGGGAGADVRYFGRSSSSPSSMRSKVLRTMRGRSSASARADPGARPRPPALGS